MTGQQTSQHQQESTGQPGKVRPYRTERALVVHTVTFPSPDTDLLFIKVIYRCQNDTDKRKIPSALDLPFVCISPKSESQNGVNPEKVTGNLL